MISQEQLRDWYLKDLEQPDTHHGRTAPKARHIKHWEAIESVYINAREFHGGYNVSTMAPGADIWCWSDIHWGHKNIIKYAEGHRPYNNVDEMNAALIANYKAVVKPDDIVIFGGDIGFISENAINDILHDLPGYKIWIVGNHDIHRDGKVYNLHMNERHLCLALKAGDIQLLLTHYPLDKVPHGCQNIHGHIHQNVANDWNINICVEHTGCAPRNIKSVIEQAQKYLESV